MPKLFLTYAWKDNLDRNVDQVVKELGQVGVEVAYDRAEFGVGDRLWEQIDTAIRDETTAGWAIYLSEDSLSSEPCMEELTYALLRALKTGAAPFPMITIMASPIDWDRLPSALRARLGVNLQDPLWATRISDRLLGRKTVPDLADLPPAGVKWHKDVHGLWWMEVWPRSGRWDPFVVLMPSGAPEVRRVSRGPRNQLPGDGWSMDETIKASDGRTGIRIAGPVDALTHAYLCFDHVPEQVYVGELRQGLDIVLKGAPLTF